MMAQNVPKKQKTWDKYILELAFAYIVKLLQGTEMSHIWMVMDNVYGKSPKILCYPELRRSEMSAMLVAIKFLKKYPREDRPYLKLIEDDNNLIPLQSNNFIYFAAAAQAIAGITQPSMKNMSSNYTETVKAFQNRVLAYMEKKTFLGSTFVAHGFEPYTSEPVKNLLIK